MIKETIVISMALNFQANKNLWDKTDGTRFPLFSFNNVTETYYVNVSQFTLISNNETFTIKSMDEIEQSKIFFERYMISSIKVKVICPYTNVLNVQSVILNNKTLCLQSCCENYLEKSCDLVEPISLPNGHDFTDVFRLTIESQATDANHINQNGFRQFMVSDKLQDLNMILIQLTGVIKKQVIYDVYNQKYNQLHLDSVGPFIGINDLRRLVTIGASVCKIKKIHIANTFFFEGYHPHGKPVKVKTYRLCKGKLFDMKIKDNLSAVSGVIPLIRFKKGVITTYKFKDESEKLYNFFFICTSESSRLLPICSSRYIYVVKNTLSDNDIEKIVSFYNTPLVF